MLQQCTAYAVNPLEIQKSLVVSDNPGNMEEMASMCNSLTECNRMKNVQWSLSIMNIWSVLNLFYMFQKQWCYCSYLFWETADSLKWVSLDSSEMYSIVNMYYHNAKKMNFNVECYLIIVFFKAMSEGLSPGQKLKNWSSLFNMVIKPRTKDKL